MWWVAFLVTAHRPCLHASFSRGDALSLLSIRRPTLDTTYGMWVHSYALHTINTGGFAVLSGENHMFVFSSQRALRIALWNRDATLHDKVDAVKDMMKWHESRLGAPPCVKNVMCVTV